jgi:predicted AAA+ superfamily ATPase
MRYLTNRLKKDLKAKMILLSGPRQTGKTWLAKELAGKSGVYLNWDIRDDRKIIQQTAWPKKAPLVVLDELHKQLRWKSFLKGVADQYQNRPPLLVTGSARLEAFRHEGDALTGRYYLYRLHPLDTAETRFFLPEATAEKRLTHLLATGGFPEAFLNPKNAERLRNDRFELVLQEDLRDLSKTNSLRGIRSLVELLRERTGGNLNYANLAGDLHVSPLTVKHWVELLEQLYVIFLVQPYSKGLSRSLRKEPKFYFYDCAAAYAENPGPILENAVACALFKYCHFQRDALGRSMALCYFRDREKREVDFVIVNNRKVQWCIEVKQADDRLSPHLDYLHQRVKPEHSFQLVRNLDREQELRGISLVNAADWLDGLGREWSKF